MDLFVYGILRESPHLRALAAEYVEDCRARGYMANVQGDFPMFPVVEFDGAGPIVGEMLLGLPEADPYVLGVIRMELGAGYKLIQTQIWRPDGETQMAFAFERAPDGRGVAILDGDWRKYEAEFYGGTL